MPASRPASPTRIDAVLATIFAESGWGQLPGGGYDPQTALRIGWLRIVSHPLHFTRKALWEAAHLWTLDCFVLHHLRNRCCSSG